ncbi:protein ZNF365 isoform X1 [Polypterus senegalus]|uniref:protein ZNF365 isoform X1 n=2 Tax=Polypterus senegalus TaxID=55291 RepID=UPI001962A37A|nr:protein ZNF365 isoform X1 [Polypterus senegalus]
MLEMQQKVLDRKRIVSMESFAQNIIPPLPFRCPRCGEHRRFRSLACLRAHLDYSHTFDTATSLTMYSLSSGGKPVDSMHEKTISFNDNERYKQHLLSLKSQPNDAEKKKKKTFNVVSEKKVTHVTEEFPDRRKTWYRSASSGNLAASAVVMKSQMKDLFKRDDCAVEEKRLEKVIGELAQTNRELANARAQFLDLSQKKQEVHARERALSRQVDVAVEVIANMRHQLLEFEKALERKEREVISIHSFLEAAVQHEMCGKARLQHFIEYLLWRIDLAERHLEYYQKSSRHANIKKYIVNKNVENSQRYTKAWSSGDHLVFTILPEKKHSQNGSSSRQSVNISGSSKVESGSKDYRNPQRATNDYATFVHGYSAHKKQE